MVYYTKPADAYSIGLGQPAVSVSSTRGGRFYYLHYTTGGNRSECARGYFQSHCWNAIQAPRHALATLATVAVEVVLEAVGIGRDDPAAPIPTVCASLCALGSTLLKLITAC
jgi:hypothetical protein